ncbi:MAG: hypothetical protein ACE5FQ_01385 [Thiogranum sp.]
MADKILSNEDIVEKLVLLSGASSVAELARKLGTERQNLKSYENKKSVDLNSRIITMLINFIESE